MKRKACFHLLGTILVSSSIHMRGVKRIIILLLALSLILPWWMPDARAEGSIWYVKPVAAGTGDCSTWENACTLQDALTKIAITSGDQIWVAAGTYTPGPADGPRTATFQLLAGVSIYGGFGGGEDSLSQRNWTTNVVTLSGDLNGDDSGFTNNGENAYHVVKGATGATLDGVTIRSGNANNYEPNDLGGGMYIDSDNQTLSNIIFSNNWAKNAGGLYNSNNSNTKLTSVTFSGNWTDGGGGGMLNSDSSPTLSNVTFKGNTALSGGGMTTWNSSPTLNNVTFSGNRADLEGGGMDIGSSTSTLTNVTFSGNSALNGGGIYNTNNSNLIIQNSILWGDNGGEIYSGYGGTAIISYSIVQDGYTGTGNINADPLLAPLGNNGGELQTMALLPGSPAIDATRSNCPVTDERGVTRSSPNCDLGAFESQGFTMTKAGGDGQSTFINNNFALPLCVTLIANNPGEPVDAGKVTFTPPGSGPSAALTNNLASITGGTACASAVANNIDGSYNVPASAAGAASVTFSLTNKSIPRIYLPILLLPAKGISGLSGKVTMNGAPAPGVSLDLRLYNGSSWSNIASTTTEVDGSYLFGGVPALGSGQSYYVHYQNESDPSRLAIWDTAENTTFNATSVVSFATFDIANIALSSPQPGATVSLPFTFSWTPRPSTPTDRYIFILFDPEDLDPFFLTDPPLGYVSSYKLLLLPGGFTTGVYYGWSVMVTSPDGGFGLAYYLYFVKFN